MHKIEILLSKFLKEELSNAERKKLLSWLEEDQKNIIYFEKYILENDTNEFKSFDTNLAFQKFKGKTKGKNSNQKLFKIYKYAAIFAGMLLIGYVTEKILDHPENFVVSKEKNIKIDDENIKIILEDGTIEVVDSNLNSTISNKNGDIIASKVKNIIDFSNNSSPVEKLIHNEIIVPYGQMLTIRLSDGSTVWLNSGSKIRFPQNFLSTFKERKVYLEGEAFFDVTKDSERPFIVNTNKINIQVLGTKFNISSYNGSEKIETTLVEGEVLVYDERKPKEKMLLAPSFQASFDKEIKLFSKKKVDTSIYTAWLERKLIINSLVFPDILKKLERKFNVSFINEAKHLNTEVFRGEFHMNQPIEDILQTIALSTPFTYKIDKNIITIK